MRLESLTVKNFCGIKAFSFCAGKRNVCIKGKNGTGKSTLKDALHWLLQNCDSEFKAFNPKPLNEDGSEIHHLETVVEAVFDDVTLKKVFKEVWKKKRGSLKKHFTGHTSTFFVNEVPTVEKDFKATVAKLIGPDEAFRVLLDPYFLPEVMPWQQRRQILLALSGDVSNEEVFKANPKLKELELKMGGYSTADYMKMLNASLLGINKEIESIPARIDEISLMTPDVSELDLAQLKSIRDNVKSDASENKKKIKELKEKSVLSEKEKALYLLQKDLEIMTQGIEIEKQKRVSHFQATVSMLEAALRGEKQNEKDIAEAQGRLESCLLDLEERKKELALVEKWEFTGGWKCDSCGQVLPEDQAREQFETRKSNKIDSLRVNIMALNGEKEGIEKELKFLEFEPNPDAEGSLIRAKRALEEAGNDNRVPQEWIDLDLKVASLIADIEKLRESDNSEEIERLKAKNKELERTYNTVTTDIAKFKTVSELSARLNELTQQETTLAMKYEEIELEKFMLESFIRARVSLLNDKVIRALNVPGLAVKMFKAQINGGLKEICEFTFMGIPWSRVNRSQQIIVGLELIEVMSKFYGVELPVFVDNAEAVNEFPELPFQIISLEVTEDKKLTVTLQ